MCVMKIAFQGPNQSIDFEVYWRSVIEQVDAQTDQVDPGMPCAETASAAHSQGLVQVSWSSS